MDENKTDILREILGKSQAPDPPQERPQFEYPPEEDAPPPPPPDGSGKKAGTGAGLLPWLCMLLGAALLVMGICLLQLVRMNDRLDSLEETVQSVALIDQLQRDNKILQEQQEELEQDVQDAKQRTRELEWDIQAKDQRYYTALAEKQKLHYLWYLDRFMDAGDYPMAAAAVVCSMEPYRAFYEGSPAWANQYQAYRQELIDKDYLQQLDHVRDGGTDIWFADQWYPGSSDDMAVMGILWCAMDAYFVQGLGGYDAAAQYLYLYPLGDPSSGYQDRVERLASGFTLEQFQEMKDGLVENENLTIAEDGAMTQGPGFSADMLYSLPFELPDDARRYSSYAATIKLER